MSIVAASGGLIAWQSNIETPVGIFQFVLGRDAGVTFFGYQGRPDSIVSLVGKNASIEFDFPIVEYRPLREFEARPRHTSPEILARADRVPPPRLRRAEIFLGLQFGRGRSQRHETALATEAVGR